MKEDIILDQAWESYFKYPNEVLCNNCNNYTGDIWYEPDSLYVCSECYTELNDKGREGF